MDSDSLFLIKTSFYNGAYRSVAKNPIPSKDSSEYLPILLYTARAHIALNDPETALSIVSADVEPPVRAIRALASYFKAKASGSSVEAILDELRDLTIEIEGEEENSESGSGPGLVKVAAATAFFGEGETEEALATLGAGTPQKDLECVYLTTQIYLTLSRLDLAKRELTRATSLKKQYSSETDSLLLQHIEAAIGLVTGGNPLNSAYHIYDEQAASPGSSSNASILSAKGVAYLMRGHLAEAKGAFKEALEVDPKHADAIIGEGVVALLGGKIADGDESLERLKTASPSHPLLIDLEEKSALFDKAKAQYAPSVKA